MPPPADARVPHHMPVHSSYPPPGPPYSSQPPSHPMHHPHPSRHPSNGPPPPPPPPPGSMPVGGPPPPLVAGGPPPPGPPPPASQAMPIQGPPGPGGPPDAVNHPTQQPISNGHRHGTPGPPPTGLSAATRAGKEKQENVLSQLAAANENTWVLIGAVSEQMNDPERALAAFEIALRHNPNSLLALNAVATIARSRDNFDKAIEYFQRILNINQDNGEVWGSMGHCLLMKDDLPKAYTAYQQALHYLPNPKEPKLWYGIGILYDRYGSFDHAEEAFSSVLKMDPNFEKANEIYFRLGIIYKHQRKYSHSLECFRYIINNPPRPLTSWDIWFQLGHVYELDHDFVSARDAYMRVLGHQPDHAKVLQQLGWLYTQSGAAFANIEQAVSYLTKSLETDGTDAQSWYLLGRAFMAGQRYSKAYEAYQQAVYRDGRNPTFWCSIGVLYFQINQYRDALDAYSRAIRINPYIWEVWYNLGSLYESCNNQITDAIDAYSRAAELDPTNGAIKHRLQLLQQAGGSNQSLPPAPAPVDVHPAQYNNSPNNAGGYQGNGSPGGSPHMPAAPPPPPPATGPPPGEGRDLAQPGPRDLPAPPSDHPRNLSPGPFRGGGAPPPLNNVEENRGGNMLQPINTERPDPRDLRDFREGPGPSYAGPPPGRYDPTADRRMVTSPGSPGARREPAPPQGYPYPPHHPGFRSDHREREEWERRDRERRAGMPPQDPRQPSPRLPDNRGHMVDPRGPRVGPPRANDPREFARPPDGPFPPYGYERGGPPPPGSYGPPYDPRRDIEPPPHHERGEMRPPMDREIRRDQPMNGHQGYRHPSLSRELANDMRAPSPAASTSSKTSTRRKPSDSRRDDGPSSSSKKPPSKKAAEKKDKRVNGDNTPTESPRPVISPAPSNPAAQRGTPPRRPVDEDYDEGAADALMFLHADRRPSVSQSDKPTSPTASTIGKRPSPPSPEPSGQSAAGNKKTKPSPGPPTAVKSPTRRTVIEVLNQPRLESTARSEPIKSPLPPLVNERSASASHKSSPRSPEKPTSKPISPPSDRNRVPTPKAPVSSDKKRRSPSPHASSGGDPSRHGDSGSSARSPAEPVRKSPPNSRDSRISDKDRPRDPHRSQQEDVEMADAETEKRD